jgi:hypothetical protein
MHPELFQVDIFAGDDEVPLDLIQQHGQGQETSWYTSFPQSFPLSQYTEKFESQSATSSVTDENENGHDNDDVDVDNEVLMQMPADDIETDVYADADQVYDREGRMQLLDADMDIETQEDPAMMSTTWQSNRCLILQSPSLLSWDLILTYYATKPVIMLHKSL